MRSLWAVKNAWVDATRVITGPIVDQKQMLRRLSHDLLQELLIMF